MCRIEMAQGEANQILAVGHKVEYEGEETIIETIRVWHDLDTLLGPPFRYQVVFDLKGRGLDVMNVKFHELRLWSGTRSDA